MSERIGMTLMIVCACLAAPVACGQGSQEQLDFWAALQNSVIYELDADRRRLIEERPEVALSVFAGISGQWRTLRDQDKLLEAAEFTPFLFHLAVDLAAIMSDEGAAKVRDEIKLSPKEFRDRFELFWKRRAMAELTLLVRDHALAAYGCAGAMIKSYKAHLNRGEDALAAYDYEIIGPLVILINDLFKDSTPQERAKPAPPGWKPPDVKPTFIPGSSALTTANATFELALAADRRGEMEKAFAGYMNAANLYEKLEEPKGQLAAAFRAAEIATQVGDWNMAGRVWRTVEELSTELQEERVHAIAVERLRYYSELITSGEVSDMRPTWERDVAAAEWRSSRGSLKPLASDFDAVSGALGSTPVGWRWVAIGADSTAELPLPGRPRVSRLGGDLYVDARLDGKASLEILPDADATSEITLEDENGKKRKFLIRFYARREVTYMGVKLSLGNNDLVFYRADGALEAKIGSESIKIVDASGDGRFNTFERDGVIIGRKSRWVTRLSRILAIDEKLFEIAPDPAGEIVRYREVTTPTGTIKASVAHGKLAACLFRPVGTTQVLLDAALGDQSTIAPADLYVLDEAVVVQGERRVHVRTGKMDGFQLEAGATHEVKVGEKLTLDFSAYLDDKSTIGAGEAAAPEEADTKDQEHDRLIVAGGSITISGALGEVYEDFSPMPLLPEVEIEVDGEIKRCGAMLLREDAHDYLDMRMPKDLEIEVAKSRKSLRVRLIADHPLLGRVESEWKAIE